MPPLEASPLPRRYRPAFTEKAFRRFALVTTVAGLALMAWGLNYIVMEGRFVPFILLFILGGVIASLSVFAEVRALTPEEQAALARREHARRRRSRRWEPSGEPEEGLRFTVTLYTREGCATCREAREYLEQWRDAYGFDVWEEDVDANATLKAQWSDWVPVGMVGDEELFRLSLDPATVEPRLARLARRRG